LLFLDIISFNDLICDVNRLGSKEHNVLVSVQNENKLNRKRIGMERNVSMGFMKVLQEIGAN